MSQKQPNVLLFITDQQRADHIGCSGNDIAPTPNIDSLARDGVRFTRSYVTCPICMPNRASLMTSRPPSLHGVRQNGASLSRRATTFVHLLRDAGYDTALIGKSHLQNMSARAIKYGLPEPDPNRIGPSIGMREAHQGHGLDGRYDQELRTTWTGEAGFEPELPWYGFDTLRVVIGHGDKAVGHYGRWLDEVLPDNANYRGKDNALKPKYDITAPQTWKTAIPEELHTTQWIADETVKYLENHAQKSDRPFFIQCSFPDPHHPFTAPGRYFDMFNPDDMPLPDAFHQPQNTLPPQVRQLWKERDDGTSNLDGHTVMGVTAPWLKQMLAVTYGMIAMIDDGIGQVLAALDRLDQRKDTVIVFMSDHGDMMGDHQLVLKGAVHYRGLVNTPLIWSDPTCTQRGVVSDLLCSSMDVATSILARCGVAIANGMQGRDLAALVAAGNTGGHVVIEEDVRKPYMGFGPNNRARTLITERWRLTLYSQADWGELYELEADPNEFMNRWDDPDYGDKRTALLEDLVRAMMAMADSSPLSTGHGP